MPRRPDPACRAILVWGEDAGLVRRRQNKEDGRLVEVHLTEKGRRLVDVLAVQHHAQLGALAAVTEAARRSAGA